MDNIINLKHHQPVDPILKRGDLVRLVNMEGFFYAKVMRAKDAASADSQVDEWCEEHSDDFVEAFEGVAGLVISIEMVYSSSHEAPGQAAHVNVAVPMEDGWDVDTMCGVPICCLHRVLGPDADEIRGWDTEEVEK
jgi:hypothetical protein